MDKRLPSDKQIKDIDPKERAKYQKSTSSGEAIIHLKDFEMVSEAIKRAFPALHKLRKPNLIIASSANRSNGILLLSG